VQASLIVKRLPIRVKLTLAYSGVIALMLGGIGTFLYLHFKDGLDSGVNQALIGRASDVTRLVRQQGTTRLSPSRPLVEPVDSFAQILDSRGRVLEASPRLRGAPLLTAKEIRAARSGRILMDRGERSRLLAQPVPGRPPLIVAVGASLEQREHALETLGAALLIGGPLTLLFASAAGYALASAALRPVDSMRRRAATVSAANPGARLPLPESRDELYRLGSTLNQMLADLERALEREQAFVSDASHELRTPLTILKTELEVALRTDSSKTELRSTLESASEETDRLARLAQDLLVLARSDTRQLLLDPVTVGSRELLEAVATRFAQRGQQAGRGVVARASESLPLSADKGRLEQALGNLVDNALRYGEGEITLSTTQRDGLVELHVRDRGSGFPAAFLPRAFERFSRANPGRGGDGAGLGLAITAAIAEAHGGSAHATNGGREGGADVWLSLPAAPRG
jgi:two-component system, OmpR family, sensor kinase